MAFILLNLACLSRVVLIVFFPLPALWLAGVCWALAFALYAWHYGPMLLRARVDGHPG
ncbi:NnrS protein [compost metagenome]